MIVPTSVLCPMVVYPKPNAALWADLDENGMEDPLEVLVLSFDDWVALPKPAVGCRRPMPALFPVLAVKVGNQRLAWLRARSVETVEVEAWQESAS